MVINHLRVLRRSSNIVISNGWKAPSGWTKKSDTVDGRNPAPPQHVWNPVNNGIFTISASARFLPSTNQSFWSVFGRHSHGIPLLTVTTTIWGWNSRSRRTRSQWNLPRNSSRKITVVLLGILYTQEVYPGIVVVQTLSKTSLRKTLQKIVGLDFQGIYTLPET